ncbi:MULTISPECIES: lysophospholipid acyltransferase family protein [Carnobacterium]|uniref:1-acyl-sn-glycerol-3-phosphate acyltransferase n=2 Tax=Carnobacterium inhibens TaxID=147709 RepID=U5SC27_9LACT|nr:1-acyl-sn-glycerol-3-phosphate acyltransferase [Carnobacterium inhibens]AGY81623.1 1-acyl-sn-glycerol-3-phosphate acyltransferase [Carnobacterium inhibens subsp. gilichinskyi]MBC9824776.1 1-acyl-sn-glycerol-3-phosphate acyltransferase [Carnobacterium inhibens]
MFYKILRAVLRFLLAILNGNAHYENRTKLPTDTSYILVAPHRTWIDPVYLAIAASPKPFTFMAKKELFKNPILSWIIRHANAFPVDRANPGPSAIKTPVKILKKGDLSLMIFPTGTRHSNEIKGGAATIAKLSGVPIIPAVYQGPLTLGGILKRKKVTVRFGDPITIDRKVKLSKENLKAIDEQIQQAFDQLDMEIDPSFKYEYEK